MDRRLELHEVLVELLGNDHVYYQPPSTLRMEYPCIRYELAGIARDFANNKGYIRNNRYSVTLIDEDPDSKIRERMLGLPYCSFERFYAADGLNHFVFNLYY